MKKLIIPVVVISLVFVSYQALLGASNKCVVIESQGNNLELRCERETRQFKNGDTVKIKSDRKKTSIAIEGC